MIILSQMYSGQFMLIFRYLSFGIFMPGYREKASAPVSSLWIILGRENKSPCRRYSCATFSYLFVGEGNNTYQLLTSIRFLSPCLCWFYITQGRKVLAFDLCVLTIKCPWWLIILLWEFSVVLTSLAANLKQINV